MRPISKEIRKEILKQTIPIIDEIMEAKLRALAALKEIMLWERFREIDKPLVDPLDDEQLNQNILDIQNLIDMNKYFGSHFDPNPQPANQLKYIQSLQSALKTGSNWIESTIDRLDFEPTDSATLAIIEGNLNKSLQALQSVRKLRLMGEIAEFSAQKESKQDINKITLLQKEARIVNRYDKLTLNIFDNPTPIPANQLLLIHSLHEALKDDIYWFDKEIKNIEKGITK